MKRESCDVTEADRLGRRQEPAPGLSEEVSSCEAAVYGSPAFAGMEFWPCARRWCGIGRRNRGCRTVVVLRDAGDQARGKGIWWMPWH